MTSSAAASSSATQTPSQILSSTSWETTGAVDNAGKRRALSDPDVKTYVGYAYFDADGTFAMYNLDDTPKMQGDWKLTPDGKTRIITAKDENGKVRFTRSSPIETLTPLEFTYRTYPVQNNQSIYIDIVHTPTTHKAPIASSPAPSSSGSNSGSMAPSSMPSRPMSSHPTTPIAPGSR
ncbi:DUF4822 domain-containing protein [Jongsikchunia kroppenstedtii]|uniref:DUF4822 domain-containing protein n=1 Tax=Jongsikchunia kroppenstedtii TaxID=1121721 RepID=UPI00036041DD|nr:DUF4822 domain-containing protein [Jongsikchunia kroppenstedtii]